MISRALLIAFSLHCALIRGTEYSTVKSRSYIRIVYVTPGHSDTRQTDKAKKKIGIVDRAKNYIKRVYKYATSAYKDAPLSDAGKNQVLNLSNWIAGIEDMSCDKSRVSLNALYNILSNKPKLEPPGVVAPSALVITEKSSALASCDVGVREIFKNREVDWGFSNLNRSISTGLMLALNEFDKLSSGFPTMHIQSGLQEVGGSRQENQSFLAKKTIPVILWSKFRKDEQNWDPKNFHWNVSYNLGDFNSPNKSANHRFDWFCDWLNVPGRSNPVVVVGHPEWLFEFFFKNLDSAINLSEMMLGFDDGKIGIRMGPASMVTFGVDMERCRFIPGQTRMLFGGLVGGKSNKRFYNAVSKKSRTRDIVTGITRFEELKPIDWTLQNIEQDMWYEVDGRSTSIEEGGSDGESSYSENPNDNFEYSSENLGERVFEYSDNEVK